MRVKSMAISGNITRKYGQKYGTNVAPFEDPEIPIEYICICFRNLHIDMYNYLDATLEAKYVYIYVYIYLCVIS
jgi:hypothetical protein